MNAQSSARGRLLVGTPPLLRRRVCEKRLSMVERSMAFSGETRVYDGSIFLAPRSSRQQSQLRRWDGERQNVGSVSCFEEATDTRTRTRGQ